MKFPSPKTVKICTSLLLAFFVIPFFGYLIPFNQEVIIYNDYPYYFPFSRSLPIFSWDSSMLGHSKLSAHTMGIFGLIPSALAFLGITDSWITYFIFIVPFILMIVGIYLIIQKLTNTHLIAIFSALFFATNNYVLEQVVVFPGYYFINVIGLLIIVSLLLRYIRNDISNGRLIMALIITSLLLLHPFLFAIGVIIIFCFFTYRGIISHRILGTYKNFFLVCIGMFLFASYWLIPLVIDLLFSGSTQQFYANNQKAVADGYSQFIDLTHLAIGANYPGYLYGLFNSFSFQDSIWISLNLFVYSVILIALIFKRNTSFTYFLLFTGILLFSLALGVNSPISGGIWSFLVNHVPGFGLFRSSSRFYIGYLILLMVLFGTLLSAIIPKREKYYYIAMGALFTLLGLGIFGRNMNIFIPSFTIPNEYYSVKKSLEIDGTTKPILSLPTIGYESYNWSVNTGTDKYPQMLYFQNLFFNNPVIYNSLGDNIQNKIHPNYRYIFDFYKSPLNNSLFTENIRALGVNYVIVHKDQYDISSKASIKNFSEYIQYFNEQKDYNLVVDNAYFSLFSIKNALSVLSGKDIFFQKKNDSVYSLDILGVKQNEGLNFLQSFHPEWKLYLEPYVPLDCGSGAMVYSGTTDTKNPPNPLYQGGSGTIEQTSTGIYISQRGDTHATIARSQTGMTLTGIIALNPGVTREVLRRGTEITIETTGTGLLRDSRVAGTTEQTGTGESYHVTECPAQNTFYAGGELAKLWQEPIFDDTHQMVYDYANQWTIDPEYIRANYPKNYYKENPDGTIDVRMTMYFRSQSYFYLGLIISGVTLFGCISYLVISTVRAGRKAEEQKVDSSL